MRDNFVQEYVENRCGQIDTAVHVGLELDAHGKPVLGRRLKGLYDSVARDGRDVQPFRNAVNLAAVCAGDRLYQFRLRVAGSDTV